jgi:hypothetical protein
MCAFLTCILAHETAGAARTRSSLRPLLFGGERICKTRAQCVAGMWRYVSNHQRHCEEPLRRSNPVLACCMDCIAALAMTILYERNPIPVVPASAPGPIRRGLAFSAVWLMPSFTTSARGYGSRRKAGTTTRALQPVTRPAPALPARAPSSSAPDCRRGPAVLRRGRRGSRPARCQARLAARRLRLG